MVASSSVGVHSIPRLDQWKKLTSLGPLKVRSRKLRRVDCRINAYHKAISDYGKDWEAREIRIALNQWKKSKPDWNAEGGRNKNHAITQLESAVTARIGPPAARYSDGEVARNLRYGVLHFLSHAKTDALPSHPAGLLNTLADAYSDFDDLRKTDVPTGWSFDKSSDQFLGGKEGGSGFLSKLHDTLKDMLWGLVEAAGGAELAKQAAQFVVNALPDVILKVLGGVLSQLGAVKDFVSGLSAAAKAAIKVWKTRNLEEGIISGHPRMVVNSVRDQIKAAGYDGVKEAVKAALVGGLGIAGAGVAGTIVSALMTLYSVVTGMFGHLKEVYKLNKVFTEAKRKLTAKLYEQAEGFNEWFKGVIKDLPIISSYCMTMPMTGSYYGFLTLVTTDGTELRYKELERNYALFNSIKAEAKGFIDDHGIKLSSSDPIVSLSLKAARESGLADNAKASLIDRLKSTVVSVVESAAG